MSQLVLQKENLFKNILNIYVCQNIIVTVIKCLKPLFLGQVYLQSQRGHQRIVALRVHQCETPVKAPQVLI